MSEVRRLTVSAIITGWVPGSEENWTWGDEYRDLNQRICVCCDQPGHYQRQIVEKLRDEGEWWDEATIVLGNDGRVWDGHHRICAAMEIRKKDLPVELVQ